MYNNYLERNSLPCGQNYFSSQMLDDIDILFLKYDFLYFDIIIKSLKDAQCHHYQCFMES